MLPFHQSRKQKLIPQGYPAIKLKKFFVTDDPWLSESESSRSPLPPAFSPAIYKKMNHDLTFLNRTSLEHHFATLGKDEDRIYSSQPLIIKDWIAQELKGLEDGDATLRILEDYISALNAHVAELNSVLAHE